MSSGTVIFNHGLHAGPWGTKIQALADVAREAHWRAESVDFRGLDDPKDRVERLVETAEPVPRPLMLVGSSLGAWVATAASPRLEPDVLFLMAPAFHLTGLPEPEPAPVAREIVVVHGWRDAVVPVGNALRFARRHHAATHLFDADHRLIEVLPQIGELLGACLRDVVRAGDP